MSEPFIAEIRAFGGNFAPRGWALCDGQLLAINSNEALFSLLGTIYGGDGRTTFALPDLRGRVAIGSGQGAGLSDRRLGSRGGAETVSLTASTNPLHDHGATARAGGGPANRSSPDGNALALAPVYNTSGADVSMSPGNVAVGSAGSSQAHANLPPLTVVNFIIALTGIFPSRN